MELFEPTVSLFIAVAWGCGVNLYAALGILGYFAMSGTVVVPYDLRILADPNMIAALALLYVAGFFIDKTPWIDSVWDGIHTFIRIPGAAVVAYYAVTPSQFLARPAAALAGGFLATISHSVKFLFRLLVNRSPEPFTNIVTSLIEDLAVFVAIWMSIHHAELFLALFAIANLSLYWIVPLLWRQALRFFEWPE